MALQTNQTPGPDQPNDRPASSGSMHQRAAGGGVESAPSARDTTVKTTQDYVNLFTNFGTPPDVTAYLEHIDKHLIGTEQWFPKDTIQRISLQQPTGAQAIIAQDPNGTKYAAVLVFESALNQIQSVDYAPVSDRLEEAGAWLRSRDSSINIVSGYVLTNDDLPRVNQMINALARDLIPFTNESAAQFNAKQMALQGYEFVVDHNINSVRDFCDQHSDSRW